MGVSLRGQRFNPLPHASRRAIFQPNHGRIASQAYGPQFPKSLTDGESKKQRGPRCLLANTSRHQSAAAAR